MRISLNPVLSRDREARLRELDSRTSINQDSKKVIPFVYDCCFRFSVFSSSQPRLWLCKHSVAEIGLENVGGEVFSGM